MFRCNETGREFEQPIYDRDFWDKNDGAYVCPCCGDTHYDEVFECDICRAHVTWDDGHVGSKYENHFLCPDCRKCCKQGDTPPFFGMLRCPRDSCR